MRAFLTAAGLARAGALQLGSSRSHGADDACLREGKGEWVPDDGLAAYTSFTAKHTGKWPELCPDNSDVTPTPKRIATKFVSECLDPFDGEAFFQALRGKTLSMVGDSLSGQNFERLLCSLPVERVVNVERPKFFMMIEPSKRNHDGFHRVTMEDNTVVQFLYENGVNTSWPHVLEAVPIMKADVLVFNVGSWIPQRETLEAALTGFASYATEHFKGRLFYREFSPPHFSFSVEHGMDYDASAKVNGEEGPLAYACEPGHGLGTNEFKRSTANELMERWGFQLIPIYETSSQRWDLHAGISKTGQRDCNHWAQPSPVVDVWNRMLLKFLKEA